MMVDDVWTNYENYNMQRRVIEQKNSMQAAQSNKKARDSNQTSKVNTE